MALIDLLTLEDPSKSTDQNQSKLVNMYLDKNVGKGKYDVIALPTPGLPLFCDTGEANVRTLFEQNGVLYAIAGNHFYSINSSGVLSSVLGTLNTSSGYAKIKSITGASDTNNQLIMIDGTNGYAYNIGTSTAQFPITDADFPQTCIDIETQDDYVFAVKLNSISYQLSNLSDTLNWNVLDFASKTGDADRLVGVISHNSKIWLMGTRTAEVWYNSGNAGFPIERVPDSLLHDGLVSSKTLVSIADYILFLRRNIRGGYSVAKIQPSSAYVSIPISTPNIDSLIDTFSTVADAFAYSYFFDGHEFYEITFPTAGYTFSFDLTSGVINERKSYTGSGYSRFKGSCQAFCYGKNFIGDYSSGKIYYQDAGTYTENGTNIQRSFTSPGGALYAGGKRVFVPRLQIDVETGIGTDKTFTLEKSMDNGLTWTTVNTFTVPQKGGRIYATQLGSSRYGILFRITTTMDAKFIILGFQAEMLVGHS